MGIQWYPYNNGIFIIVHPVVFLNKLILEMSICDRMVQISKGSNDHVSPSLDRLQEVFNRVTVSYNTPILFPRRAEVMEKALPPDPRPESMVEIIEVSSSGGDSPSWRSSTYAV